MNTETITLTEQPILVLERRAEPENTLETLLTELRELGIAPAGTFEQLRAQQEVEEKDLLSYLILNILYPAIVEDSDDRVEQMLALEERAKALLAEKLPAGDDVEVYLEQLTEQQMVMECLVLFEQAKRVQLQTLQAAAHATQERLQDAFGTVKQRITLLAGQLDEAQGARVEKINALRRETQELIERTQELAKPAKNMERGFNAQQQRLRDLHGS